MGKFIVLSILIELISNAVGLTTFKPAISCPECLQAYPNILCFSPIYVPLDTPGPPVSPAPILVIIDPYKLGITITSNSHGFLTNYMQVLSTIISSNLILGNFLATSLQLFKNKPSTSFIILALCTHVTFFLPVI